MSFIEHCSVGYLGTAFIFCCAVMAVIWFLCWLNTLLVWWSELGSQKRHPVKRLQSQLLLKSLLSRAWIHWLVICLIWTLDHQWPSNITSPWDHLWLLFQVLVPWICSEKVLTVWWVYNDCVSSPHLNNEYISYILPIIIWSEQCVAGYGWTAFCNSIICFFIIFTSLFFHYFYFWWIFLVMVVT